MSDTPKKEENPCGHRNLKCKLIVAYVSLSSFFLMHSIDIISRHVAVAFKIPIHNIGIYFDKLYALRWFVWLIGTLIEYGIFQGAGADRDKTDLNKGRKVRRYVNIVLAFLVLLTRVGIVIMLFCSTNLAYNYYILICLEGFLFGPYSDSYTALCSQYIIFISPIFNLTRIFIFAIQFVLDRFWYDRPLFMVKVIFIICALMTTLAFFMLYHLNFNLRDEQFKTIRSPDLDKETQKLQGPPPIPCESELCEDCKKRMGKDGEGAVISPILMNYSATFVKEFLYPATLPYAVLPRDKCHMINMLVPFANLLGPLFFFLIDNLTDWFKCWSWYFDLLWLLFVPLPIINVYPFLAIHTRNPSARRIINSRPIVTAMTLIMVSCYGFLNVSGIVGVAKYAFRRNPYGFTIQGINLILLMTIRTFIAKVSVGYTDTRISLGYHLPKFRPTHRMSASNLRWYIFRQTFKIAWSDLRGDLKLNMKKYL